MQTATVYRLKQSNLPETQGDRTTYKANATIVDRPGAMSTPTLPDSVKELRVFDSSGGGGGGGGGVMDSSTAAKLVYSRSCLARFMFQPTAKLFRFMDCL